MSHVDLGRRFIRFAAQVGANPEDDTEVRLQKTLLVISALMMASLAILWGIIYYFSGNNGAAIIPWFYSIISFSSMLIFSRTRQYRSFRFSQLLLPLLLPFLLMIALGGFVNSSAVILWSFSSPLGALVFSNRRESAGWFAAFIALLTIAAGLDPFLQPSHPMPPVLRTAFFIMNIGCTATVVFVLLQYFVNQKDKALHLLHQEQGKSERLLLNILPRDIADALRNESRTIATQHEQVSVMFADIVNFTPLSAQLSPVDLVALLNAVFSYFDNLTQKYQLEKIKTIGDCYMVAAGIPRPRVDHAQILTRMALEIRSYFADKVIAGHQLTFRIGINSGPVVAGVIGNMKFTYDLWGDTVNTASRMESHTVGGQIQISKATHDLVKDEFYCEARGTIHIKGKGPMEVWQVSGPREQADYSIGQMPPARS